MISTNSTGKPNCKLPEVMTVSHLIGRTVTALREAGSEREMREFLNEIRKKELSLDYYSVITIASRFVSFHE